MLKISRLVLIPAPQQMCRFLVLLLVATVILGMAGCSNSAATGGGGDFDVALSQSSGAVGFPHRDYGSEFRGIAKWQHGYVQWRSSDGDFLERHYHRRDRSGRATSGSVVVTVSGIGSAGVPFTVIFPPVINTLSQNSGAVGASITIAGSNFGATQGGSSVTFNGTAATVISWSASSIVATVPVGSTPGNVIVVASNMASNGVNFAPGPSITGLSQNSGAVGSSVQVTGTNFGATQGSSTLTFNGTTAIPTSWSSTTILVTVPAGAATGNVVVAVSSLASNGVNFTVVVAPIINTLSMNSGSVGTSITIAGANFGASQGASTVSFNGTKATVNSWNAASIITSVPVGATSGNVVVTVSGVASNGVNFMVTGIVSPNCAGSPTGDESLLSGRYVFLVQGWSAGGVGSPVATVLSFAPNGAGAITNLSAGVGGEADTNGATGAHHFTVNSTGSLYTVGKDPTSSGDIGCASLSTSLGSTLTFAFSLGKTIGGVYTKGRIIRFDDTSGAGTRGSGVLLRQTAPFGFSGSSQSMVFGENGWDVNGHAFSGAGNLTLSPAGLFSNLSADFNDAGTMNFGLGAANPVPGATSNGGFNASPDAMAGYATITDSYTANSTNFTLDYAAYQVNPNEYFYISTDAVSATTPLASGRAMATGASFTPSSLSGAYIVHETGSGSGTSAQVGLGLFNFTPGTTTIGGTLYQYAEGSAFGTTFPSGNYAIASASGRATFTGTGFGANNSLPILYLAAPSVFTEPISAFVVGTDLAAGFGLLEASSGTFSTSTLAGNFFSGTEDPSDNTVTDKAGVLAVTGILGACTGTDYISGSSGLSTGLIGGGSGCTITISNANGTGNVGANTLAITNGISLFFFDEGSTPGQNPAVIHVIEKQ